MSNDHHHKSPASKNLKFAFFLNFTFFFIELIGGIYVNSVAIVSDAIHDLGDSLSLGTAWYLQNKSHKPANSKYSYGYQRFSLLGALINGLVLILGSAYVIREAIIRIQHPENSDAQGMLYLALLGIFVNGLAMWRLQSGSSMNEKVVSLHFLEDILGWIAVLVVSIILHFKNIPILDPILSLGITAFILVGTFSRLKDTLFIFLQGVPKDISYEKIKKEILSIPEIYKVIELHIWSLEGEHHVFSTKIQLKNSTDLSEQNIVKEKIYALLSLYPFSYKNIEFV